MALRPAIFLDKDGTVLRDVPFNVDPARMEFECGVRDGLGQLARLGWPVFIISNQPGVALGRFPESALRGVHEKLATLFLDAGLVLAGLYYCPHPPHAMGRDVCDCRKPAPGLLRRAAADHGLDLARSWMVGDILDDVEAGSRAGCRTVLVDNGNETEWKGGVGREPTVKAPDFSAAVQRILNTEITLQETAA
jgi:D-glycero-D-manno-heptose 1,7-bisphosphate phosphatase